MKEREVARILRYGGYSHEYAPRKGAWTGGRKAYPKRLLAVLICLIIVAGVCACLAWHPTGGARVAVSHDSWSASGEVSGATHQSDSGKGDLTVIGWLSYSQLDALEYVGPHRVADMSCHGDWAPVSLMLAFILGATE